MLGVDSSSFVNLIADEENLIELSCIYSILIFDFLLEKYPDFNDYGLVSLENMENGRGF